MSNKKSPYEDIKLLENTALDNINTKKGLNKTSLWIKNKTLDYEIELKTLQVELMKLQLHLKEKDEKVLAIFEGRDAAGKGGTIKRLTAHLNPRNVKVVALAAPTDREKNQWYFQRYLSHLPAAGELVIFDRSWYNRSMVEPVMQFCTDEQNKRFLKDVPMLEEMLVKNGIKLFKFYFSVSKHIQEERFDSRKGDPLKQYKLSPVDSLAQEYWDKYSIRKFEMLTETNRTLAPWTIIRSDVKKLARINCIKHILSQFDYKGKISSKKLVPDPDIVISGIDEIKHMQENLMTPDTLRG